jgi:hypothetical protein
MTCIMCKGMLDFSKVEWTIEQHYERMIYGLFADEGIKEETIPTLKETTGRVICDNCGALNEIKKGTYGYFSIRANHE